MDIRYPATFEPQGEGGYFVQFVDLPDTFTEGETLAEAMFNASEVLSGMLAVHIDAGDDVPTPSQNVKDAAYIAPDAKTQVALLMRNALGKNEVTLAHLARVLETSWPAAKRLTDPHHWPSLKNIDRAATAMGKRLVISFE